MSDVTGGFTNSRHLTAFFDTREAAEIAVAELRVLGLSGANVRLTGGDEFSSEAGSEEPKGFGDGVSDFFLPDEARETYSEGLRRGGYLMTVSEIPAEQFDEVVDILDDEGSVDLDERAEAWRSEGWRGSASSAADGAAAAGESSTLAREDKGGRDSGALSETRDEVIPVVEERLRVGKRDMNLGRVRVRSYVVEEPVSEEVNLRAERVEIERRPVDRALDAGDAAFVDRVIEAEERAEEAVVRKEARVVEEIGLRKISDERTETISDTVRRTEVEVEDDRGLTPGDPKHRGV